MVASACVQIPNFEAIVVAAAVCCWFSSMDTLWGEACVRVQPKKIIIITVYRLIIDILVKEEGEEGDEKRDGQ